ncbi:hypothetical protein BDZ89DRAFT_912756, partial [Hymenopellis radicata]
ICLEMDTACWEEDKVRIKLHRNTMLQRYRGRASKREYANEEKAWLNTAEQESVVDYCIALANRGFPLNNKRVKEIAEKIARGRHGDAFPVDGLGKKWVGRFVQKHTDRL